MQAAADFRQERHELEAFSRPAFQPRPNLAQVLTYVCAKYFEGAAEQIKEYNIAVEALGRPRRFRPEARFHRPRGSASPAQAAAGILRGRWRRPHHPHRHSTRPVRAAVSCPPAAPLPSLSAETLVASRRGDPGNLAPRLRSL